ncbi:MAG TPA: hypothetical protein VJA40_02925 [archaeon]|nr:hypothetical protein [archaeon]
MVFWELAWVGLLAGLVGLYRMRSFYKTLEGGLKDSFFYLFPGVALFLAYSLSAAYLGSADVPLDDDAWNAVPVLFLLAVIVSGTSWVKLEKVIEEVSRH